MKAKIKSIIYNSKLYIYFDRLKTKRLRVEMSNENLKSACEFDWSGYKSSDTLFILGTGMSVMSLSDKQWEVIKSSDSFGFNGWIFHDFVPTYYGLEPMASDDEFEMYLDAIRAKSELHKYMPIFAQYQHLKMRNKSFVQPGIPQENIFYNAPFMPFTLNISILRNMIKEWVNTEQNNFCEVMHYAGSLSYVLCMSYIMGYKKIVLLGVDLNSTEYFFEHPMAGELAQKFKSFQETRPKEDQVDSSKTHSTMSKKYSAGYGCLPISVFVEIFRDAVKPKGVEVLIGNSGSALYPMLKLWTI